MTIGWQKANLLNCLHMLSYGSAPNMMEGGFQLRPATLAQWPARARGWTCLCSGSRDAQSQQCVRRCAHHHERLLHFYAEQHRRHFCVVAEIETRLIPRSSVRRSMRYRQGIRCCLCVSRTTSNMAGAFTGPTEDVTGRYDRSPAAQRDTVLDLYFKPIGVMS